MRATDSPTMSAMVIAAKRIKREERLATDCRSGIVSAVFIG
jgi:hypothetical protein